ncbi:MAG TPA: alpha/beta fold hydrolase [Streptosporangiaceae bacterium]
MPSAPAAPAPALAAPWGGRDVVTDLGGPVHWVDFGGPPDTAAPPLVLVHGLGGSHLDWVRVAPALAAQRRVLALDLPGFGLTPAAGRPATVSASAALLGRFVREVAGAPAVLAGNSMGGTVALLQAGADPHAVAGLVLIGAPVPGSWPWPHLPPAADFALYQRLAADFALYATPGAGEFYLWSARWRLTPRQQVERTLALCFADPRRASPQVTEASVALAEIRRSARGTEQAFLQAARSLGAMTAWPARYRALAGALNLPVLVIHGEQDRLVPAAAARRAAAAHPGWATALLRGVGHTPQLEAPGEVVAAISPWLAMR